MNESAYTVALATHGMIFQETWGEGVPLIHLAYNRAYYWVSVNFRLSEGKEFLGWLSNFIRVAGHCNVQTMDKPNVYI